MSIQVTLERDGHDQPWGFRLQGGVDVSLPLSVMRVLVGSPSESILKKGDVVTKIGQTGTHGLTHQQAADLFNCAGNQITVTVKRPTSGGVVTGSSQPSVSALQASAAIRQQQQQLEQQQSLVSDGISSQSPQVAALPRTTFVLKSDLPPTAAEPVTGDGDDLSVTNQPYRTLPLVQPSAKVLQGVGLGSYSHLKLQEDICSGVREPQLVPITAAQAKALKANDYIMKQKTEQGLVSAASDVQRSGIKSPVPVAGPIAGPVPVKLPPSPSLPPIIAPSPVSPQPAKYNSAAGLYGSNPGTGGQPARKGGVGMINPTRSSHGPPAPVVLVTKKDYNPTESATWKLIREQDPNLSKIDLLAQASQLHPGMNEHDPIFSEVYAAPKVVPGGPKPGRPTFSGSASPQHPGGVGFVAPAGTPIPAKGGSPRLSGGSGSATPPLAGRSGVATPPKGTLSHVAAAALAEPSPLSSGGRSPRNEPLPIYETNSIGGRKRIAQSSSFNKLMMNMLGE